MARTLDPNVKRPRLSLDVDPDVRRRVRVAAARRDVTVRQYVLDALLARLDDDLGGEVGDLAATGDPVLAELWDNPRDAAYDRL
jgi:hypothetical protein